VFWGGWDGHEPQKVSDRFAEILRNENFDVEIVQTEAVPELDVLRQMDLIVSCSTGGNLPEGASKNIATAVGEGVGLAGCHGGMCDAFRIDTEWQFLTGGQWVSHPGGDGVEYTVSICHGSSPLVEGLTDFPVKSEHYYLHVDPAIEVLATTRFPNITYYHASNKPIDMPVVWTKYWGLGRVYYCSLGHHDDVFEHAPTARELMRRGMLWAAGGKAFAAANGLTVDRFLNNAKMY
jgi:type 1 glutamine amidotransferase